jgi:hypothetical protein
LEEAVLGELHPVIVEKLQEIVKRLYGMGHRLLLDAERPGEVHFHDPHEPPAGAHCWLRVGVDTVISAGWAGVYSAE